MQLEFKGKFRRDLSKINDRQVIKSVIAIIENIENAVHLSQINHLVKLRDYQIHYRIEAAGNYRIGIIIRGNKVWFVRILHRSKIYKEFP